MHSLSNGFGKKYIAIAQDLYERGRMRRHPGQSLCDIEWLVRNEHGGRHDQERANNEESRQFGNRQRKRLE